MKFKNIKKINLILLKDQNFQKVEVNFDDYDVVDYEGEVLRIENTWDIFSKNDAADNGSS